MKSRKPPRIRDTPPPVERSRPSSTQADGGWRRHTWRLAVLWALISAAYSNSFQSGLVFDSAIAISKDPRIHAATPENLRLILTEQYWHGSTTPGLYRPLTTLSYLVNYSVFGNGTHPAGYHWVNLALHEVNVSLTYALGLLVIGAPTPAFALAALWGLHPLLTESVTNVVGRADLLAALGVLTGLLCYLKSASATGWRKLFWLAGMVVAQGVGLFSKENAAVLPTIMLLFDFTWPGRAPWRERVRAYAALTLPFAALFYCRGGAHLQVVARLSDNPLAGADFWTARLTALKVIGNYMGLIIWPARLSADYSYNAVPLFGWHPARWEDAKALIAVAVCGCAVLLAARFYRVQKPAFFFLGFFFIALFPTSNLVILIGSIMAERFVYLPSIGLVGCVVGVTHALAVRGSREPQLAMRSVGIALGFLCLACGVRTFARNADWVDELRLWTSAVKACPGSAKTHYNLADALLQLPGRLPDAIAEYEAALRIRPDYAEAHNGLGSAQSRLPGRLPDAIAHYRAALAAKSDYAEAYYNLGNAFSQMPGHLPEAVAQYQTALRIEPDYAEAHNNLGLAFANSGGRLPEAIAEYRAALRINPDLAEAHNNLGNALSQSPEHLLEAINEYRAALRLQPDYVAGHNNLGSALSRLPGHMAEAMNEYEAALRLEPNYAEAHNNLGLALVNSGERLPEAVAHFEAVLKINPNLAEAHNNLGVALAMSKGRLPEAISHFETALRIKPDYAQAHSNLGDALLQLPGRMPDAIAQYEAALRISRDPELRQLLDRLRMRRN
jgi:protein O-mannosyl-transferase